MWPLLLIVYPRPGLHSAHGFDLFCAELQGLSINCQGAEGGSDESLVSLVEFREGLRPRVFGLGVQALMVGL